MDFFFGTQRLIKRLSKCGPVKKGPAVLHLVQIVFLSLLFHHGTSVCKTGWFGVNCSLKCRCALDNCSQDGDCIRGLQCLEGWFGPACQYEDLVYKYGNVSQLWARDGDDTTCNPDSQLRSILVTFPKPFHFTWLRMVTMNRIAATTLQITFNNNALPCAYQRAYAFNSRITDVACDVLERIRSINITGAAVGYLCSLYVNGGVNFAVYQPANQSSTYREANIDFSAGLAVDGNSDGYWYHHHCSSTQDNPNSYWNVFFREPRVLSRIVLFNRDDIRQRLHLYKLRTYSSSGAVLDSFNDTDSSERYDFYDVTLNSTTATSRIYIQAQYILTLCEVEAYGDLQCPDGKWGLNCSNNCRCGRDETCFPPTGLCSMACPNGFYGPTCATACPSNCEGDSCYYRAGDCFECKDGYVGVKCKTACTAGLFGKDCMQNCPQRCREGPCNVRNGHCISCEIGFYGDHCSNTCSKTCEKELCHGVNGSCFSCTTGHFGYFCNLTCPSDCLNNECDFTHGVCLQVKQEGGSSSGLLITILLFVCCAIAALLFLGRKRTKSISEEIQ